MILQERVTQHTIRLITEEQRLETPTQPQCFQVLCIKLNCSFEEGLNKHEQTFYFNKTFVVLGHCS